MVQTDGVVVNIFDDRNISQVIYEVRLIYPSYPYRELTLDSFLQLITRLLNSAPGLYPQ